MSDNNQTLAHHGIKGMKWGRRRFQNADGSLTPAGKSRYNEASVEGESKKVDLAKVTTVAGTAKAAVKKIKGIKLSEAEVKNKAADILDHLESEMFFKGDNVKNNFAIRAGMRSVSENLRSGTGLLDTTIDALNEYKFFADD